MTLVFHDLEDILLFQCVYNFFNVASRKHVRVQFLQWRKGNGGMIEPRERCWEDIEVGAVQLIETQIDLSVY